MLGQLTEGLADISNGTASTFDIGPLTHIGGKIEGVLDRFGFDLSGFISEFKDDYFAFQNNFNNQTRSELQETTKMKPRSLSQFGSLLQIGSKKSCPQPPLELRYKLWDKLASTFPSYQFNGVALPGLSPAQTFESAYPIRGEFPVRDFLPAIAVAYGRAPSFVDPRAKKFTMDDLFTPEFGPELSLRLLEKLRKVPSFEAGFSQFDSVDPVTGLPMMSQTKELFDVNAFIPGTSGKGQFTGAKIH